MIITQRFNSVDEIDPEFISPLEDLLSDSIPSFQILKNYEVNSPMDINFSYYLFFGNQTNAPIGFAQIELKNEKIIKQKFLKKLFNKDPVKVSYEKSVRWTMPGSSKEGIVFKPQYIQHACEKAKNIFDELFEENYIISQELRYSQAYTNIKEMADTSTLDQTNLQIADTLIKNQNSYQTFLEGLSTELQKEIKSHWKSLQCDLKFKMGDYKTFKECFEYKTRGPDQYKTFKSDIRVKKFLNSEVETRFITFESPEEIKTLIIFSIGNAGNSFYEVIHSDDEIPSALVHQLPIIKFYEYGEANRLHNLGECIDTEFLINIGYTKKEQYLLSATKLKQ